MVPICVELPIGSKYLDNLLVTPRGDLALIECKLWRNPEARYVERLTQLPGVSHVPYGNLSI